MKTFLHVGCGPKHKDRTTCGFNTNHWKELRFDIRHDTWWSDPTHVRAFTPLTFRMMSKKQNDEWIAKRANYTMLAHVMKVDFEITEALQVYEPQWWQKVQAGALSQDKLRAMADQQWGVVKELQVKLKAVKAV